MSVIRVGSSGKYADGWDHVFGAGTKPAGKARGKAAAGKSTAKAAGKKKAKKAARRK